MMIWMMATSVFLEAQEKSANEETMGSVRKARENYLQNFITKRNQTQTNRISETVSVEKHNPAGADESVETDETTPASTSGNVSIPPSNSASVTPSFSSSVQTEALVTDSSSESSVQEAAKPDIEKNTVETTDDVDSSVPSSSLGKTVNPESPSVEEQGEDEPEEKNASLKDNGTDMTQI